MKKNTHVALTPSPANVNNRQGPLHKSSGAVTNDDKTEGSHTIGTSSSSTIDASARSATISNSLPILPAGPFPGSGVVASQITPNSSESPGQPQPAIDVTNTQDFPRRESINIADNGGEVPLTKEQMPPPAVGNNDEMMRVKEKPKSTGVWGSKRFA